MPTIEIPQDLYESLKDQLCDGGATEITGWADLAGSKVFIRTVTYHLVGKVVAVNGTMIEMTDASVVYASGNFSAALKTGTVSESEHVGRAWVNLNAVTDCFEWKHGLPK